MIISSREIHGILNSVKPKDEKSTDTVASLTNKYEKEIKDHLDKDGKPVHYFTRLANKRDENPVLFEKRLDDAINKGAEKAKNFLDVVRSPNHPDKPAAVKRYQNEFGADPVNVHKVEVAKAIKAANVAPFDQRNFGYEQILFNNLAIETKDEADNIANLKKFFQLKWTACGTAGDKDALEVYKAENLPIRGTVSHQIHP